MLLFAIFIENQCDYTPENIFEIYNIAFTGNLWWPTKSIFSVYGQNSRYNSLSRYTLSWNSSIFTVYTEIPVIYMNYRDIAPPRNYYETFSLHCWFTFFSIAIYKRLLLNMMNFVIYLPRDCTSCFKNNPSEQNS